MSSRGRLGFRPQLVFAAGVEGLEDRRLLSGTETNFP
jgi:hypothetical protein